MATVEGFVFDDEPIESLLYDEPSAGPTPASIFAVSVSAMSVIAEIFAAGDVNGALGRMAELLGSCEPLSASDRFRCAALVQTLVASSVPCPIVREFAVPLDAILEPLFAAGLALDEDTPSQMPGTTLYRWYEGAGRYVDAARVVGALLERAKRKGDRSDEAVFTNNLGYEYLLEGNWARAEPLFARAADLFAERSNESDHVNARANLLLCRYEQAGGVPFDGLDLELNELLTKMKGDWRRRKPLILLARIAELRGDLETAIDLARRAVEASKDIPKRHGEWDLVYMQRLESLRGDPPSGGNEAAAESGEVPSARQGPQERVERNDAQSPGAELYLPLQSQVYGRFLVLKSSLQDESTESSSGNPSMSAKDLGIFLVMIGLLMSGFQRWLWLPCGILILQGYSLIHRWDSARRVRPSLVRRPLLVMGLLSICLILAVLDNRWRTGWDMARWRLPGCYPATEPGVWP